MDLRSFGVEEELLLVDPDSGAPRAVSGAVIRYARDHGDDMLKGPATEPMETELQREQLEIGTPPVTSLDDLAGQVRNARVAASRAARGVGVEIAALATSPVAVRPSLTPSSRYRRMADEYARTADEQLTCGCHVHVNVSSSDEGVGVLDRIRPWLPPLLALSANSPFWQGRDTGYDSWRHQVWGRWPSSGPAEPFGTAKNYRAIVEAMVGTGALLDEGMIYFDARLSRQYPTVEVRVADVCIDAADTVLLAALVRGLVETAARGWRAGGPPAPVRTEVIRLASWRASRSGLADDLVHPLTLRPAPAWTVVESLVEHVSPALDGAGDLPTVLDLLGALRERGNGACRQRAVHERTGEVKAVVTDAVTRTLRFAG